MSLLLLDTTFLVDADRGGDHLEVAVDDTDDVAMAAITVAELLVGVELSTGRAQRSRRAFLDDVLASIPVLDYDRSVAESHALLLVAVRSHGRPRGAHDLVIAATAHATNRTVVTADAAGFDGLPGVAVREYR